MKRKRLKLIQSWRRFRDNAMKIDDSGELRYFIIRKCPDGLVDSVCVIGGWSPYVRVTSNSGREFHSYKFHSIDALKEIVINLYNYYLLKPLPTHPINSK